MRGIVRLASCVGLGLFTATMAASEPIAGKVARVIDGDSIEVMVGKDRITVHMHGIDCPEMSQSFGKEARAKATSLLLDKQVGIEKKDTDAFGRLVGVVTVGGKVANEELVRAGLAWWYRRYAPDDKALERLEKEARAARRGLWAQPNPEAPWEFRRRNAQRPEDRP